MATVSFSRKEVEKHIKLNPEAIENMLMIGIPAELSQDYLSIEVLVSRPDMLSLQGFLRAYKAYSGKEQGLKKYKVQPSGHKLIIEKSLPKEWPYGIACIVKGLEFNDEKIKEIIDIQEKLGLTVCRKRKKAGIGIYPLDKINFPVRLAGMEMEKIKFRPLEMEDEINGLQILQRHSAGREYAHIVKGWDKLPVFIDSKGLIMSMPPIINSHDLGRIDESTKDIFIEATGTDLKTLKRVINIIASTLADMGGKIYSIECMQQNGDKEQIPDFTPETIKISLENTNKLLGLELKEKDLEKLLPKMGYDYKSGKVYVPAYRTDILHEVDVIEDIAIAYGYDNFIPEIPTLATIGEECRESKMESKIAGILTGLGLIEISSYHLIKNEEAEIFNLQDKIETENAKTDYKILRPNLFIPALRILSENKDNEYPQRIFEIGKVFRKSAKSESGISEQNRLLVASSPGNFTEVKQILDYLFSMLGQKYEIEESINQHLIEGRTGEISINGKSVGFIGEVHPQTLRNFNIKMPVSVIEISLDELTATLNR